ncbi:MAG: hypothetical protein JSS68_10040 [Actinobacteria bacterium]|nr:hypothetical protein [Actinomycetota bacterium]
MSGRRRLDLIAIALAVLLSTLLPAAAGASDGVNLTGLRVEGGNVWHSENSFLVEWDPNPPGTEPVQYAIRAANLNLIRGYPDQWTRESFVGAIHVPPIPGVYYFEARTWRGPHAVGDGTFGPPVYVPLYFDDVQPAPVTVAAPPSIAAGEAITARVAPPPAPLPVSGISGYAVTFDSQPDASPCAGARHCPASAVNIAGAGAGQVRFPAAPEGIGYVHAVAVSGSGMASRAVSTTPVVIDGSPPAVHLEGAPSDWSAVPVRVTAVAVDRLSGMDAAGPTGPVTALAVDGAPVHLVPGSSATAMVSGDGIHQLQFYGRDAVGNSGDGSLPFAHPGTATVRIDESGPDVRLAAPDPTDPERIEATVADPLSGPDPDRGLIEFRRVGSSSRFQPLPTESHRGRLVARWPSDDFARGAYEFRATGYDAVGNATTSSLGAGGGRLVLQNPVKREVRLAFGFGAASLVFQRCTRADGSRTCHREVVRPFARRPAARTLPCCHGAVVGGRLVDAAGEPLAGETVEVVEDFESGARNAERRTELTTDVDGRFSTRLVPGPSRAVTAKFAGTRRLTRVGGRQLRLRVRAAVHLRVSTARVAVGGAPVVFSGRIDHPEAPIPAVGLPVQLEFRLPGMPWTEFRTVQSDALGRFRYPYSFSDDDSDGVRFLFRAAVPATGGWPFASATSRPLAVTG